MQPHASYLICTTPQSGSKLLCKALNNTGTAGRPKEYFSALGKVDVANWLVRPFQSGHMARWQESACADYLARIFEEGTTPNGVFGTKVMWDYFDSFICSLRQIPIYRETPVVDLLPAVFPNLRYIWFTRRDRARQAVFLWKAIQAWTWKQEEPALSQNKPSSLDRQFTFNFEAIDALVQRIRADEADWWTFFDVCAIQPITVAYEELVLAPEATARTILQDLHIPVPEKLVFADHYMKWQANSLTEEWVQRYTRLKREQQVEVSAKSPNTA